MDLACHGLTVPAGQGPRQASPLLEQYGFFFKETQMKLRRGKTKSILESSIDSALLAVEIYNKPRTSFRSQGFITMMIIAWTRLLHAHFNHTIGDRYYYKHSNGRYKKIDGERKAWELNTCIGKYVNLAEPVKANLRFFIGLRNKIEHRSINKRDVDTHIFGECQALLYNYENTLINLFGEEYALNEHLTYSLQFSRIRLKEQERANKMVLSNELSELRAYLEKYRTSLTDDVFNSQEYSVKLLQIPKISNTNRHELAVEFVNWSQINDEDKENYNKLTAIIKDKVVKKEAVNIDRLKPGEVIDKVKESAGVKLSHYDHKCFYSVFSIRPIATDDLEPFETNPKYCHYDEAHDDYVFQETWVDFLIDFINGYENPVEKIKNDFKNDVKLQIEE